MFTQKTLKQSARKNQWKNLQVSLLLHLKKSHMEPYAFDSISIKWKFVQENDLKHASKLVKNLFFAKKIDILFGSTQSTDLNLIENLSNEVKSETAKIYYKNMNDQRSAVKKAGYAISKVR